MASTVFVQVEGCVCNHGAELDQQQGLGTCVRKDRIAVAAECFPKAQKLLLLLLLKSTMLAR